MEQNSLYSQSTLQDRRQDIPLKKGMKYSALIQNDIIAGRNGLSGPVLLSINRQKNEAGK
jgi:hypothetical protein